MARTNIDIDDEVLTWVMHRYNFRTKREAVDYALKKLRVEPMTVADALAMEGTGWEYDLKQLRPAYAPFDG